MTDIREIANIIIHRAEFALSQLEDEDYESLAQAYLNLLDTGWVSVETPPDIGVPILASVQHFSSGNRRMMEMKRVDEDDCDWRTVDDNSEIAYEWNITHWMIVDPPENN